MKQEELTDLMISWDNLALVIRDIDRYPEHFGSLMGIALTSDKPESWRAAYMADKIHEKQPSLIKPYLVPMIEKLKYEKNSGKKRHFLKLTSMHKTPDEYDSFLIDYCLNALTSDKEPPAVRVHAMQVLFNISEKLPDLKAELADVIENEMEYHPTPGILSRGRKLLQKLRNQLKSNP